MPMLSNEVIDRLMDDIFPFGIVYDTSDFMRPRTTTIRERAVNCRWSGMTVFLTYEAREEAIDALWGVGAEYWTRFRDAQGYGLSWAMKVGA
jgi:hypothetical protein